MGKNVLMISTDRGLLNEKSEVAKRHAGYAHFADNLHILVFSLKKTHSELKIELAPNVFVYPTRSYLKPLFLLDALLEGFFLCRKKKINIIVTQNVFETGMVGYFLSKIFRTPLYVQMHTDPFSENFVGANHGILGKLRQASAKFLLPRAKNIRVVSARIENGVRNFLKSKNLPPIVILPIYANVSKMVEQVKTFSLHEKFPQAKKILITMSRLEKEKNIFMAIDVLKKVQEKVPGTHLVIGGSGSIKKELEDYAQICGLKDSVHLFGRVEEEDKAAFMGGADVFLMTSDFEGYALTLVEAAAYGTPIVSTDVGLVGDILIDKHDVLAVPVRNVEVFTEKVIEVLQDENLKNQLIENARKAVQNRIIQNEKEYHDKYMSLWN